MSAIADTIQNKSTQLSKELTQPFSGSRKIYVEGTRKDLRVGMREVSCANTSTSFGEEENPPITVYDTSGPYSDSEITVDLLQGLLRKRLNWILERDDTKQLERPSSVYGCTRQNDPRTAHLRFSHYHSPRQAKPNRVVTQMNYAKRGIITPEMEYVAIREDIRLQQHRCDPRYQRLLAQHSGNNFGVNLILIK